MRGALVLIEDVEEEEADQETDFDESFLFDYYRAPISWVKPHENDEIVKELGELEDPPNKALVDTSGCVIEMERKGTDVRTTWMVRRKSVWIDASKFRPEPFVAQSEAQ